MHWCTATVFLLKVSSTIIVSKTEKINLQLKTSSTSTSSSSSTSLKTSSTKFLWQQINELGNRIATNKICRPLDKSRKKLSMLQAAYKKYSTSFRRNNLNVCQCQWLFSRVCSDNGDRPLLECDRFWWTKSHLHNPLNSSHVVIKKSMATPSSWLPGQSSFNCNLIFRESKALQTERHSPNEGEIC